MNARERFALFKNIAYAAEHAADSCGASREYQALRKCIEENEKAHRRFGRALVGPSATRGRFSLNEATDLFVTKTIAEGYGKNGHAWARPISALAGLRDDYVRAAIIVARREFRTAFAKTLDLKPKLVIAYMREASDLADYSALANGEVS